MRSLALLLALLAPAASAADENTFAHPDQVRTTALYLDLDVDFERRRLAGFAELSLAWTDAAANVLVLDTRDLTIERALALGSDGKWRNVGHSLGARHAIKGSPLTIRAAGQPAKVRVYYHSAPAASGLQWLTPAQTQGKEKPFMFSQSQAIHARSWVPLQDTPAVRFPYRARITAPAGMRVVMSADNDPAATGNGGWRFTMPQPIPSYLLAIAVGDIAFKSIGARTGIYAEPGMVDVAAKEYEDTEKMVEAAEALYGPYRWGRYDLLVLPPSFPYGGMENPRLTFLTPTAIAGDKSLVALIAHELAHSWSGNLVTNQTWQHFWLNEGFTTYVENRIIEAVYGADTALMQREVDETELRTEMASMPAYLTALEPEARGDDPDNVFSSVPYQKGAWFLRTLEERAGRQAFDPFVRAWFDDHAFGSVTTADFVAYLGTKLLAAHPDAMSDAELEQWLHQPGIPASAQNSKSDRLAAVDAARKRWQSGELPAAELPARAWNTTEWLHFLNALGDGTTAKQMADLDAAFQISRRGNSEIAFRWYMAGIKAGYEPIRAPLEKFLVTVGRRKFIKPLFEELARTPANKAWADAVYARARPGYHPVTQAAVDAALGRTGKPAAG
jgi:aminopeptidase N